MARPYAISVMLECDVAAFLAGKARQVLKFAVGDQRRKGGAVQVVRDHQEATMSVPSHRRYLS
jgi:hypothetical protein